MKIFISGKNGAVAKSLIKKYQGHDLLTLSKEELLDGDEDILRKKLSEFSPDLVFLAAANTNLENCESNPQQAYENNVELTRLLLSILSVRKAFVVYFSSTGVYGDWKNTPYTEFDKPSPTTVHHNTKLLSERIVQDSCSKYLVIRTGWLFGGDNNTSKKNFVKNRLLEMNTLEAMYANFEQIGNPTYIPDLLDQISLMLKEGLVGIFNVVNEGVATRYEYVWSIASYSKQKCKVLPATKGFFNRISPVSNNESAINFLLIAKGLNVMPSWRESLKKLISSMKLYE